MWPHLDDTHQPAVIHLKTCAWDAFIDWRRTLQSPIVTSTRPLEPSTNPWDRQPGESGKAYSGFLAYRDLGIERSLTKAAEKLTKRKQTLYRWFVRWNWRDRSDAWDREIQEAEERATIKERAEYRKLALQVAKDLAAKAALGVHALKTVRADADGRECLAVKPTDLIRIVELSYKIQGELLGRAEEDQVAKIELHFGSTEDEEE